MHQSGAFDRRFDPRIVRLGHVAQRELRRFSWLQRKLHDRFAILDLPWTGTEQNHSLVFGFE